VGTGTFPPAPTTVVDSVPSRAELLLELSHTSFGRFPSSVKRTGLVGAGVDELRGSYKCTLVGHRKDTTGMHKKMYQDFEAIGLLNDRIRMRNRVAMSRDSFRNQKGKWFLVKQEAR
jgi:hypothetical protein